MSIIYVHGGVSGVAKHVRDLPRPPAASEGDALDLVERAVRLLEDDPRLNAGHGAVLNQAGEIELDAGIADGSTGRFAGVANVRVAHPISLARKVLAGTPHVLLAGTGAQAFAGGLEDVGDPTSEQRQRWEEELAKGRLDLAYYGAPEQVDTVGAVALDAAGNLAAGSSTGGVFGKLPGRVGDAPIHGAGFYASPGAAVVGTGVGELFVRTQGTTQVGRLIEDGMHPQRACEIVISRMGELEPTFSAGLLALDANGAYGAFYRGGSWPVAGPEGDLTAEGYPLEG